MSKVECISSYILECIRICRGNNKNTDSLVATSASDTVLFQKVSQICIMSFLGDSYAYQDLRITGVLKETQDMKQKI